MNTFVYCIYGVKIPQNYVKYVIDKLDGTDYTLTSYQCGARELSYFIELYNAEIRVEPNPKCYKVFTAPSQEEIDAFVKFLEKQNIDYPYSNYMVIDQY